MESPVANIDLLCVNIEGKTIVPLEHDDVTRMIFKALKAVNINDRLLALNLADKVIHRLKKWKGTSEPLSLNEIEYVIKFTMVEHGQPDASNNINGELKTIPQLNWG